MVVEMSMDSRNNDFVMRVLDVRQFLREKTLMMIVNEGNRANHESCGSDNGRFDEAIANQVTECFGAVFVSFGCNVPIESL